MSVGASLYLLAQVKNRAVFPAERQPCPADLQPLQLSGEALKIPVLMAKPHSSPTFKSFLDAVFTAPMTILVVYATGWEKELKIKLCY